MSLADGTNVVLNRLRLNDLSALALGKDFLNIIAKVDKLTYLLGVWRSVTTPEGVEARDRLERKMGDGVDSSDKFDMLLQGKLLKLE
jgi:hypothetical protein